MRGWKNIWVVAILLLLCACEHRELKMLDELRYIRVYLDEEIRNVSFGFYDENNIKPDYHSPEILRVVFCNTQEGKVIKETYLRNKGIDERGVYLEGEVLLKSGDYRLLIYNFDTESVHVRDENNFNAILAYTNVISSGISSHSENDDKQSSKDWKMVYEPDHFLIASYDSIHVDYETRTLYAADHACFEVSSCVKSYYVQVSIKGAEYVSSATASLSGMGGSVYLRNGQLNEADPVAIGFTLNPTQERIRKGEVIKAYTTFNTFGKLVGQENYLTITFDFYTRDGRVVTDEFRITDLFETDLVKVNQWIILDKVIVIDPPPPSIDQEDGGGMDPDVEEWVNVEGDIYL